MSTSPEDRTATKYARSVLTRRGFDISRADIRMSHGVCYIRGIIAAAAGGSMKDPQIEMTQVQRILQTRQEIRDTVVECSYR